MIKSPIFIFFFLLALFGITYFSINYFAAPHYEQLSPDGNYKVVIYKYPLVGSLFSADKNDGPGFIRVFDMNTMMSQRKPVTSVTKADSIVWKIDNVTICDTIAFPLSVDYPVKEEFKKSFTEKYFYPAVENKDIKTASLVIRKGAGIIDPQYLTKAVMNQDSAMVTLLLAQPGYIEHINELSSNVMNDTKAIKYSNMLQLLITQGISTNFIKRGGASPLLIAAAGEYTNTIVMLLKNGVNVSCFSGDSREIFLKTDKQFQYRLRQLLKQEKLRCWAFERIEP